MEIGCSQRESDLMQVGTLWRSGDGGRMGVRMDHISNKIGAATMWLWPNLIGTVGYGRGGL